MLGIGSYSPQKILKFSLDSDDNNGILRTHGTKLVSKRSYLRLQVAIRYYGPAIGNACRVQLPSVRGRTIASNRRHEPDEPQGSREDFRGRFQEPGRKRFRWYSKDLTNDCR